MARTEVIKKFWVYVREKNLQDPSNWRNVICDETLRALFNVDSIGIFQMSKALSKHIWSLDSDTVVPAKSREKENQLKHEREESYEPQREEKKTEGREIRFSCSTSTFRRSC